MCQNHGSGQLVAVPADAGSPGRPITAAPAVRPRQGTVLPGSQPTMPKGSGWIASGY